MYVGLASLFAVFTLTMFICAGITGDGWCWFWAISSLLSTGGLTAAAVMSKDCGPTATNISPDCDDGMNPSPIGTYVQPQQVTAAPQIQEAPQMSQQQGLSAGLLILVAGVLILIPVAIGCCFMCARPSQSRER